MIGFDAKYQGKVYAMQGGIVYELRNGTFYGVGVSANTPQVALTGNTATSVRGTVGYQTTSGEYIILSEGWQFVGNAPIMRYSTTQAQACVNKIIENNKTITRCNCLCARYAGYFSSEQLAQIKALQKRVVARDQALQDSGLTENVKTGYPEEYAELSSYLDKIMSDESIGLATWVVVVIAATVIAATATAAYFAYKSLADESERDVKFSKELTASLVNKLSPEEYQQLLDETKGLLTKSKIKSLVRGSWGTVKIAAAVVGAYAIYKIIKSKL